LKQGAEAMVIYNGTDENAEDIIKCAGTILSTPYASMPYMRDMGITADAVAGLSRGDEGEYYAQAADQIEEWEERVSVNEITCTANDDGSAGVKVVVGDGR